ncbi:MAG: hypothetical protein HLX50_14260, partial [Alteromonadaceae bacterium]|nr:hypothetical protein [Alteromonadaceae bacterium]
MAMKKITTPLDLSNMDNHNYNYDELKNDIRTTEKRLSGDMWEEIKDANTMKMLEPVQTAADLPSDAADKSLITVIDEQRVYAFVNDEWQPFNKIDLDPFEPFKDELAEIVATYEDKIQSITQEVQNTKTSAIDSIQSTQSQSESNINQTEQSAVNSINQTQAEAESQISTIRDEMTTQASDLTALFNDSMDKLTSKQNTALAEVDSAKQAAITEIEEFNNIDTSNWQKYKLTQDNGTPFTLTDFDFNDIDTLETGNYFLNVSYNAPFKTTSYGFLTIEKASDNSRKAIATPGRSNQYYAKYKWNGEWSDWEELTESI